LIKKPVWAFSFAWNAEKPPVLFLSSQIHWVPGGTDHHVLFTKSGFADILLKIKIA